MAKFEEAARQMQNGVGVVRNFRVNAHSMVMEDSKYHSEFQRFLLFLFPRKTGKHVADSNIETEWRRTPEYQGGFVLDGGIHIVAGLRLLLGETHDALTSVSAQSCLQQKHLAPVDTVNAVFKTRHHAAGVMSLSYGSRNKEQTFEFAGEGGDLTLNGDTVTTENKTTEVEFSGRGVREEVRCFAQNILDNRGMVDKAISPEEAMADLEVMEKMLMSAERNGERMALEFQ